MSEENISEAISLGEFLKTASERPAAELLAMAEQYPVLASALEKIKKQFILGAPDEARGVILGALNLAEKELPSQIKNTKPAPEKMAAVPGRAAYIVEVANSHSLEKKRARKRFIHQLVEAFEKETGLQIAEEKIADDLTQQTITSEGVKTALTKAAETIPDAEIEKVVARHHGVLERVRYIEETIHQAAFSALDDPVPKPQVFFSIASEKATYMNEVNKPIGDIVQSSAGLARAAVAVNANLSDLGDVARSGKFFQSFAKSGVAKAVAPAADAILDVVARINPPAARVFVETIVDASLARVTGTIEKTTQLITDQVGKAAAQSDLVQSTLKNWNREITGRQSAAGGIGKARSVFDDIAGAIFGKSIDEGVLDYAELVHRQFIKTNQLPTWQQIHVTALVQYQPHLVHFEPVGQAGGWALSWLSNTIAQKTGGRVASAVVGTAAKEAGKKAIVGLAAKFGLSAFVGAVSGGTSLALQAAAQAGFWLGGKIKDFAGFLFSGQWITNLFSTTGKADWKRDQPLILAAGAIILLIALFLFPWFFNFSFMNDLVNKEALVPGLGGSLATSILPGPGPAPGTCEVPTVGFCAVDSPITRLRETFGVQAENAARICGRESGWAGAGAATIVNDSCLRPDLREWVNRSAPNTADYSVGLFQINLLSHPSQTFQNSAEGASLRDALRAVGREGKNCFEAFSNWQAYRYSSQWGGLSCEVGDPVLLGACRSWLQNPENNVAYARYIFGGSGWGPWSTARGCGIVQ